MRPRRRLAEGRGVVLLGGRLIENLHVEDARRVVALADAVEALARGRRPGITRRFTPTYAEDGDDRRM
jgi:hypothetical protein